MFFSSDKDGNEKDIPSNKKHSEKTNHINRDVNKTNYSTKNQNNYLSSVPSHVVKYQPSAARVKIFKEKLPAFKKVKSSGYGGNCVPKELKTKPVRRRAPTKPQNKTNDTRATSSKAVEEIGNETKAMSKEVINKAAINPMTKAILPALKGIMQSSKIPVRNSKVRNVQTTIKKCEEDSYNSIVQSRLRKMFSRANLIPPTIQTEPTTNDKPHSIFPKLCTRSIRTSQIPLPNFNTKTNRSSVNTHTSTTNYTKEVVQSPSESLKKPTDNNKEFSPKQTNIEESDPVLCHTCEIPSKVLAPSPPEGDRPSRFTQVRRAKLINSSLGKANIEENDLSLVNTCEIPSKVLDPSPPESDRPSRFTQVRRAKLINSSLGKANIEENDLSLVNTCEIPSKVLDPSPLESDRPSRFTQVRRAKLINSSLGKANIEENDLSLVNTCEIPSKVLAPSPLESDRPSRFTQVRRAKIANSSLCKTNIEESGSSLISTCRASSKVPYSGLVLSATNHSTPIFLHNQPNLDPPQNSSVVDKQSLPSPRKTLHESSSGHVFGSHRLPVTSTEQLISISFKTSHKTLVSHDRVDKQKDLINVNNSHSLNSYKSKSFKHQQTSNLQNTSTRFHLPSITHETNQDCLTFNQESLEALSLIPLKENENLNYVKTQKITSLPAIKKSLFPGKPVQDDKHQIVYFPKITENQYEVQIQKWKPAPLLVRSEHLPMRTRGPCLNRLCDDNHDESNCEYRKSQ